MLARRSLRMAATSLLRPIGRPPAVTTYTRRFPLSSPTPPTTFSWSPELRARAYSQEPVGEPSDCDTQSDNFIKKLKTRSKDQEKALNLFAKVQETGGINLTQKAASKMLESLARHSLTEEIVELLRYCQEQDVAPEHFARTAVLNALCKATKFDEALKVFEWMREDTSDLQPSVYAAALDAATKSCRKELVVDIFRQLVVTGRDSSNKEGVDGVEVSENQVSGESVGEMLLDVRNRGVNLSAFALIALAEFAERSCNPDLALDVLSTMVDGGIEPSIGVYGPVLVACSRDRRWSDTIQVYDAMPKKLRSQLQGKYVVSVIKAHTNSETKELKMRGLDIFGQHREKLSKFVGSSALHALLETRQFEVLFALSNDMKRQGIKLDRAATKTVIMASIRSGSVEKAKQMLHVNAKHLKNHSASCYRELIDYYAKTRGDTEEASRLYRDMMRNSTMEFSDWCDALELAMQLPETSIYWDIRKHMWLHDVDLESKLPERLKIIENGQNLLAPPGTGEQSSKRDPAMASDLATALDIFHEVQKAGGKGLSKALASQLLISMAKHKRIDDCIDMLSYFKKQGVSLKSFARVAAFRTFFYSHNYSLALEVLEDVIHDGSLKNEWACSIALRTAIKLNRHALVLEIFDHMRRNAMKLVEEDYGNVIRSYTRQKKWDLALEMLSSMQREDLKPSINTFGELLSAFGEEQMWAKLIEVYDLMPENLRLKLHGPALSFLISAHAAAESEELQQRILRICDEHKAADKQYPYTAALDALMNSKQYEGVLSLFEEMKTKSLELSPIIHQNVVMAYIRTGSMEQAKELLVENATRMNNTSANCYRELIRYYAEVRKDVPEACTLSVGMVQNNTHVSIKDWRLALELALELPDHSMYWELRRWLRLHGNVSADELPENLLLPDHKQEQKANAGN